MAAAYAGLAGEWHTALAGILERVGAHGARDSAVAGKAQFQSFGGVIELLPCRRCWFVASSVLAEFSWGHRMPVKVNWRIDLKPDMTEMENGKPSDISGLWQKISWARKILRFWAEKR